MSSNSRQEAITKQATQIMDNFFTALKAAKVADRQIGVRRENQTRIPSKNEKSEEFRQKMFANAPSKDIDYILAEKKHW